MKLRGNLYLLGAAFLWGTTFVAQMTGMDGLGPYGYSAARYVVGLLAILIIWLAFRRKRERAKAAGTYVSGWKAGIGSGLFMFIGSGILISVVVAFVAGAIIQFVLRILFSFQLKNTCRRSLPPRS